MYVPNSLVFLSLWVFLSSAYMIAAVAALVVCYMLLFRSTTIHKRIVAGDSKLNNVLANVSLLLVLILYA